MKAASIHLLLGLATILLVLPSPCHASAVDLAVGGHLYGEYAVYPLSTTDETFSLNQDTLLGALIVDLYPYQGMFPLGSYEVTLTGPGGANYLVKENSYSGGVSTPLPSILAAGNYTLTVNGGPCGMPCYGVNAGMDYYFPATFTDIGGTITGGTSFYFELTGETVPEPGTWALLATAALLLIPVRRYWQRSA